MNAVGSAVTPPATRRWLSIVGTTVSLWILLTLVTRAPDPFLYLHGWQMSSTYYVRMTKLPRRDKTTIDELLRGWEQKRETGDMLFGGLGSSFEREHPGCYSVTYSTLSGNAKIYVLYAADGTCIIARDDD